MHRPVRSSTRCRAVFFHIALVAFASLAPALAAHADAVGHTPGEFSVDPTGAANYRIPIVVPPGIAGMQPDLALLYSSRAGNGQLGVGWSISGLSAITRCPKTKAQDQAAYLDGVDFDTEDRLCLDGQHLLIAGTSPTDNDYWTATSYSTEIASFQKIERGFSHVTMPLGSAGFKVSDKAGLTRYYGGTADSQIEVKGVASPPVMMWAVTRIEDRYQNYITFSYVETANGEFRPSEIAWHNKNNFRAGRVAFEYSDTRPDKTGGYLPGGGLVALTQRLTAVKVYARDTLVRRYNLAYWQHPVSGLSHLASVTECNGVGQCLRPTSFTWEDNPGGFNVYNTKVLEVYFGSRLADFDGDGRADQYIVDDALTILYGGGSTKQRYSSITGDTETSDVDRKLLHALPIDYNGDGEFDLLVPRKWSYTAPTENFAWELISSLDRTFSAPGTIVAPTYGNAFVNPKPLALDVNGDGRGELITRNSSDHLVVWMNGPTGFGVAPVDTTYTVNSKTLITPFEFNGDGRPDLLVYYAPGEVCSSGCPTALGILINNGAGFTKYTGNPGLYVNDGDTQRRIMPMDVNGDGLDDVLFVKRNTNVDSWVLALNTGGQLVWGGYVDVDVEHYEAAQVIDHNGDGKQDLMIAVDGLWKIALSTGTTFSTSLISTGIDDGGVNRNSAMLADFDGDGNADLVRRYGTDPDDPRIKFYWAAGVRNGQLLQATDGMGGDTQVRYWALSEPFTLSPTDNMLYGDLYVQDVSDDPGAESLAAPEYRDFNGPIYVVREFWAKTGGLSAMGSPGYVHTQYHYAGAKFNNWGRGFLGFRRLFAVNGNFGTYTVNYHRQGFPYTGMVEYAKQRTADEVTEIDLGELSNNSRSRCTNVQDEPVHADGCEFNYPARYDVTSGGLVSVTTNTFDVMDLAGSAYPYAKVGKFPYVETTEVKNYDFTKSPEVLYKREFTNFLEYDVCGNPKTIDTIADKDGVGATPGTDGHTTHAVNAYEDLALSACLGRLTSTAVTHTRPTYAGSTNAALTTTTRTSTFDYEDTKHFLIQEIIQPPTGPSLTKNYTLDGFGNRVAEQVVGTDVNRTTTTTYDANGEFVVAMQNALGQSETRAWDYRFGVQTSVRGPNGLTTQWAYDDFGRKTKEFAPRPGVETTWAYHWCEAATPCVNTSAKYRITTTGSDGSEAVTEYDMVGRAVSTQTWGLGALVPPATEPPPVKVYTETYYDSLGRNYATSLPYFAGATSKCWTYRTFDNTNRVLSEHRPGDEGQCSGTSVPSQTAAPAAYTHVTYTAYDGLKTRVSSPVNASTRRIVEREVNVMGRLRFMRELTGTWPSSLSTLYIDSKAVETEYDYDPLGNTTWVQDANGKITTLTYDGRGFKTAMSDIDMGSWTYAYNAVGELTSQTDAKSQNVTLQYDALGRLVQRTEPEGTTTWVYDTGYGAGVGKPAFVLAPDGFMEAYAYDGFGAVSDTMRVIGNELYWVSQIYDELGRPRATVYPDIQAFNAGATPSAPAFVSPPTTSNGNHTLTWNETSDYAIYRLYRHQATTPNSSLAVEIYTSPNASFTDAVSANGNNHYWVKACHAELCSALSAIASVAVTLPPAAPAKLTVPDYDTNNDGIFTVSWDAVTGSGITYQLQETTDPALSEDPNFSTQQGLSTVYNGASTSTPRTKAAGRYFYRVRACVSGNCGPYRLGDASTLVELKPTGVGTPNTPTRTETYTFTVNQLSASGPVNRYDVYRSTWSGSCTYADEALATTTTTSSTSVTVPSYGKWCVRVAACNITAQADICTAKVAANNVVGAGPSPAAPAAVSAPTPNQTGSYTLNWASQNVAYFEVDEATNSTFTQNLTTFTPSDIECVEYDWEGICVEDWPLSELALSGKTNGTTYYYRVRACATWGCGTNSSTASVVVAFPPGVPASITVPATSTGSYTVSWGTSTGIVTAYELYESTSSSFTTQTLVYTGTATSKAITKAASGTFYYRVRALNTTVPSGYRTGGNSIVVTVSTAPSVPTLSTSTTFSTDGTYTISWTQSTGTVTAYELERSDLGGPFALNYTGTALSKNFSHAHGEFEFDYRVRACNGTNCSAYSNVVSVYVQNCGGSGCVYVLPPRRKLDEPEPDRLAAVELDVGEALLVGASSNSRSELVKVSSAEAEGFRLMPPPRPADLAPESASVAEASASTASAAYHVGLTPQPVTVMPPKPVKPLRQHPLLIANYLAQGGRLPFKATKTAIGNNPSGNYAHAVMYFYGAKGQMHMVAQCNGTSTCTAGTAYWRIEEGDAAGRVIRERLGNGVVTTRGYDEGTGALERMYVDKASPLTPLQELHFTWDMAGSLTERKEDPNGTISGLDTRVETFTYDALQRLATSAVSVNAVNQPSLAYTHSYDPVGNLKSITNRATNYQYGSTGHAHAVTQATVGGSSPIYAYDANGNQTTKTVSGVTRQVCWQTSNHPTFIAAGTVTNCATGQVSAGVAWNRFSYAPDRSRYMQQVGSGPGLTASTTNIYVGSLFEKEIIGPVGSPTSINYLHYIRGNGRVVATFNRNVSGSTTTDTTEYWHRDQLENVIFRTNASGDVIAGSRMIYDAWGKPLSGTQAKRNRGYTGHEHLNTFGLIHMNGRVYDPDLGRFLSPDTFVQFPESTQGFNRYTYVGNSPLSANDPSGHFSWVIAVLVGYQSVKAYEAGGVDAMVEGWVVMGISAGMASAIGQFAAANSALIGGFTRAVMHGASQGLLSKASGGRFGDGFLGGFSSSLAGPLLEKMGPGWKQTVAAAIVGGTVSKIGGGSFTNGATTAAFVNAFNDQQHMRTDEAGIEEHAAFQEKPALEFDISDRKLTYKENGEKKQTDALSGRRDGKITPRNKGALEPGIYVVGKVETVSPTRLDGGYCDKAGNCWRAALIPQFKTSRTELFIHPDGNLPGTLGCIGLCVRDTSALREIIRSHKYDLIEVKR